MSTISENIRRAGTLHIVRPARKPTFADLRRAIHLFSSEYATRDENKKLRVKWLNARAALGDKALLATPVKRIGTK